MDKAVYGQRWRQKQWIRKMMLWGFLIVMLMLYRWSLRCGAGWENRVLYSARKSSSATVLVTGAAGFIGSHVSVALKRRGDGVVGLDSFNDLYEPLLKRDRQSLLEREGLFIVEGDINDSALLLRLFALVPFSHVMHLAAQSGVRHDPLSYVHTNVAGLVTVLEVCKSATPQPSLVLASSSSVYGLNTKSPFSEADRTDRPASLYAATKKAGEAIAHSYNHVHGLSITALRFFTVYGPWGRPDMAYYFFTKAILDGDPIQVYQGSVARDFTYIDDVVKACLASIDTAERSTGGPGKKKRKGRAQFRIFNIGNTSPVPVTELVGLLEELLNVKAIKEVLPLPANGDVPFTHANVSYAQRELHYRPTMDLRTGLKKFIKWYLTYNKPPLRKKSS